MIGVIGDNIVSPLGFTTEENWQSLLSGKSELRHYETGFDLPEPFCTSLIDEEKLQNVFSQLITNQSIRYTKFEKISIISAAQAIAEAGIDASAKEVVFILSTTKGNVELLQDLDGYETTRPYLWRSAELIAQHFGNTNRPIVVSNACISGCAAQVEAMRLLENGPFRYAVVVGADVLSKFVISGFQSFKALSTQPCQPFDAERTGLNLGEAAATLVFASDADATNATLWLQGAALCNDANHISAPSRTAEGLVKAFQQALEDIDNQQIAFINAHGTATRYNDDMESVAVQRMGMNETPINSLKGYFGHTLGAAGILETIISARELHNGKILPTRGFKQEGTVAPLNVTTHLTDTDKSLFVKMISGFGGSNAVLIFSINKSQNEFRKSNENAENLHILSEISLNNHELIQDGETILKNPDGSAKNWLTEIYHHIKMDYPKFFKMDRLCKAGTLAAELLMGKLSASEAGQCRNGAVVIFNSAGSLDDDRAYQETIQDAANFFPSPSIFVYTLSNIVTGEIAIRHKILGESSCFISQQFDYKHFNNYIKHTFAANSVDFVIGGWCDYDEGLCNVRMSIFTK